MDVVDTEDKVLQVYVIKKGDRPEILQFDVEKEDVIRGKKVVWAGKGSLSRFYEEKDYYNTLIEAQEAIIKYIDALIDKYENRLDVLESIKKYRMEDLRNLKNGVETEEGVDGE